MSTLRQQRFLRSRKLAPVIAAREQVAVGVGGHPDRGVPEPWCACPAVADGPKGGHEIRARGFEAAISPESGLLVRNSVLGQSNPKEMDSAGSEAAI